MGPEWSIVAAFKAYGWQGALLAAVVAVVAAWAKRRFAERDSDRSAADRERLELLSQLKQATTSSVDAIRQALESQQKMNDRWFDVVDRNTRAMEKLVERMGEEARERVSMQGQLSRIEGTVAAIASQRSGAT